MDSLQKLDWLSLHIVHHVLWNREVLYKYHHSTKLWRKISRVCCHPYCYDFLLQVMRKSVSVLQDSYDKIITIELSYTGKKALFGIVTHAAHS